MEWERVEMKEQNIFVIGEGMKGGKRVGAREILIYCNFGRYEEEEASGDERM
jgi:hypothetical protein